MIFSAVISQDRLGISAAFWNGPPRGLAGCARFVIMAHLMYLFPVKSRFEGKALSLPITKILFCTVLLLGLASSSRAQTGPVMINELAASNGSIVENGGKFPDWIELYNTSLFHDQSGLERHL